MRKHLIEISGRQLPGLGGKMDVVTVMHLGQVVEAAGLQKSHVIDYDDTRNNVGHAVNDVSSAWTHGRKLLAC